jgi:hypothetical protein
MKSLSLFSFLILAMLCLCCNQTKKISDSKSTKYQTKKISCNIFTEESFDSTFKFKGDGTTLKCKTECFNDYVVPDTINDSIIELYQERLFRFSLKNSIVDTQFVVTKELIKDKYSDRNVYNKSLLVYPRIEHIDTLKNTILIHSEFMYPSGLEGTDFFESILFEINLRGQVTLKEIKEYEEPGMD